MYNSLATITASLESAFAQSYPEIEIVVVDDASTDGTFSLLRQMRDPRLRLIRNRRNRGPNRTWNATIAHSRGEYVKFLHHDDLLEPECVAKMARALVRYPSAGIAFSRRALIGGDGPLASTWADTFRAPHEGLMPLGELNDGRRLLLRSWAANRMQHNCVGEPVATMVRRTALEEVGLFHLYLRQLVDAELWIRILARTDAAFIDEQLASYAVPGHSSLTARNLTTSRHWVDRAWMLEAVVAAPLPTELHTEAAGLLEHERSVVSRTCGSMLARRTTGLPYAPALSYLLWRAANRIPVARRPAYGVLDR